MVCRGVYAVNSEKTSELFPKSGFKLVSPVCGDSRWDTKPGNPATHKGLGHSLGREVHEGNGLWPAGEPINAGEHVAESLSEPTRSNRTPNVANEERGVTACRWNLDFWHWRHAGIHDHESALMLGQTKRAVKRRYVAQMLG